MENGRRREGTRGRGGGEERARARDGLTYCTKVSWLERVKFGGKEGGWREGEGKGVVNVCRDVKQNEPVLLSYYQGAGNQETVVRTVPERLSCETRQGISKEYLT